MGDSLPPTTSIHRTISHPIPITTRVLSCVHQQLSVMMREIAKHAIRTENVGLVMLRENAVIFTLHARRGGPPDHSHQYHRAVIGLRFVSPTIRRCVWVSTLLFAWLAWTPSLATSARLEIPVFMESIKLSAHFERQYFGVIMKLEGKNIHLLLDTGSRGLAIFRNISGISIRKDEPINIVYLGSVVRGYKAKARIEFAGLYASRQIEIAVGSELDGCCLRQISEIFDGVLGIGSNGDLENPIASIGNRWILDFPRKPDQIGRLILNPDEAEVSQYTMLANVPDTDETFLFRGCLNSATPRLEGCGTMVLDIGSQSIYGYPAADDAVEQVKRTGSFSITVETVNSSSVSWNMDYIEQYDSSDRRLNSDYIQDNRVIMGWPAFSEFSILYDYSRGTIGLRHRN